MKLRGAILYCSLLSAAVVAQSQSYSIDRFTISGGGGSSTGGVYSLTGTIGQADAGRLSSASYVLEGGFWGFVGAVQTPGAPALGVERLGALVRVFWPSGSPGFLLDESTSLGTAPGSWSPVTSGYQTNDSQISISVPAVSGPRYYRLRR